MPVRRTYQCDTCEWQWTQFHASSEDPYPGCPKCEAEAHWVPQTFAISTNKSRAVDMAQRIAEEDYGLTDMRDNLREGDTVVKPPPPVQGAEAHALTQMMVEQAQQMGMVDSIPRDVAAGQIESFWKGGMTVAPEVAKAMAAPGAVQARQDGSDPVALLHKGEQAALGVPSGAPAPLAQSMRMQVVGRAKAEDVA